jgi:glycosyltransferase involved in cell wall biosynthesis
LRVTHCYRTYFPDPPGGLQEAIRQICLATAKLEVKNAVFCLSPHPEPQEISRPECKVVRSRSWLSPASCDLGGWNSFAEFRRLVKTSDVLHQHFPWPFADVLHLANRPSIPAVMTYHSDIIRQKYISAAYRPLMWKMLSSMRFIVATSPAYLKTSPVLSHPCIRDRVRVIPLGIDEDSYPVTFDASIFQRLGLNEVEPYFLFLGVLRYYKGLHTLLHAAVSVSARIIIAGSGPDATEIKALATRLNAKNVIFAGQVSDSEKIALLKNCRAFILPSHLRSEAFGMVLVEAAMFGRALISCEIGSGTSFVNAHEETGFVVPPEDPSALARAMNSLLAQPALASTLGENARKRYEQLFSGPALGRAYAELYKDALQ